MTNVAVSELTVDVMMILEQNPGGITAKQVGDKLNIARSKASSVLAKLLQRGDIRHPTTAFNKYELTAVGHCMIANGFKDRREHNESQNISPLVKVFYKLTTPRVKEIYC